MLVSLSRNSTDVLIDSFWFPGSIVPVGTGTIGIMIPIVPVPTGTMDPGNQKESIKTSVLFRDKDTNINSSRELHLKIYTGMVITIVPGS